MWAIDPIVCYKKTFSYQCINGISRPRERLQNLIPHFQLLRNGITAKKTVKKSDAYDKDSQKICLNTAVVGESMAQTTSLLFGQQADKGKYSSAARLFRSVSHAER